MGIFSTSTNEHDRGAEHAGRKIAKVRKGKYYDNVVVAINGVDVAAIDGLYIDGDGKTIAVHEHKSGSKHKVEASRRQVERAREALSSNRRNAGHLHTNITGDCRVQYTAEHGDRSKSGKCYIVTAANQDPSLYLASSAVEDGRWGIRDGKPIWVNDQVAISKAFQIFGGKIYPDIAGLFKSFYDSVGSVVAESIMNNPQESKIIRQILKPVIDREREVLEEMHLFPMYIKFVESKYSPRNEAEANTIFNHVNGVGGNLESMLPIVKEQFGLTYLPPHENESNSARAQFSNAVAGVYGELSGSVLPLPINSEGIGYLKSIAPFVNYLNQNFPDPMVALRDFYNAFAVSAHRLKTYDGDLETRLSIALKEPSERMKETLNSSMRREYGI